MDGIVKQQVPDQDDEVSVLCTVDPVLVSPDPGLKETQISELRLQIVFETDGNLL